VIDIAVKVAIALIVLLLFFSGLLLFRSYIAVEENGGVKEVLINTGKEFKDIWTEIEQYTPPEQTNDK